MWKNGNCSIHPTIFKLLPKMYVIKRNLQLEISGLKKHMCVNLNPWSSNAYYHSCGWVGKAAENKTQLNF